ncbi:hypothetical protein D3P96_02310 [Weissella viridescens]|uniref:Uncharacterized protein n=1 Tax=Weissella viridescens TaxID=1629 RepID=A0A3P2RMT2_WEIVI|nr:hypothetical protein [Weissella viridescens]RRG18838.1 hypothetical protein D3P96_02310 [Weissella viridescens]
MRKFIFAVIAIIAMVGVGFFSYQYVQNKNYDTTIKSAEAAVTAQDWQKADADYKQAQSIKMTPETRTAETQLDHAIKAKDATEDENWHLAQSQYHAALDVDGGLDNINTAVQKALDEVNHKNAMAEQASKTSAEQASAASAASESAARASFAAQDRAESMSKKQASEAAAKAKSHAKPQSDTKSSHTSTTSHSSH